jgi:hypothetical protein
VTRDDREGDASFREVGDEGTAGDCVHRHRAAGAVRVRRTAFLVKQFGQRRSMPNPAASYVAA